MSRLSDPAPAGVSREDSVKGLANQLPVAVHSCSRLGRVANPPGFSFSAWFRRR